MRDDGGPAFPVELRNNVQAIAFGAPEFSAYQGMTMRDYFAAKAMAAMAGGGGPWPDSNDRVEVAKRAYHMADAMLAERNKGMK